MSKGIFITGTDTGVGKTLISAAIIRALISKGVKAGAMKPIETGCENRNGELIPSDGMFLKGMAEMDDSIDLITPIRFEQPLSPLAASEIEKRPIKIKKVFEAYKTLSKKYNFMVVEGAGGILVPIDKLQIPNSKFRTYFISDLIKDLRLPVVVVTPPALGMINHTLLTVNYALREGINVIGIVVNFNNQLHGIAEKTNPEMLKKLCPTPIIGILPYFKSITKDNIEETALQNLDLKYLL